MRKVPKQKPGQSRQDYGTPRDLLTAVERRFGAIDWDYACTSANSVVRGCGYRFDLGEDALTLKWADGTERTDDLGWLNPPFSDITSWAMKCAEESASSPRFRIAMLVPASIGSEWFRQYVYEKAYVLALNPRVTFVGEKNPYPKDCILCMYGMGIAGFEVWRWK